MLVGKKPCLDACFTGTVHGSDVHLFVDFLRLFSRGRRKGGGILGHYSAISIIASSCELSRFNFCDDNSEDDNINQGNNCACFRRINDNDNDHKTWYS